VKGIRWTEKDHLWGVCRGREMHRSRIDRNKEARLIDQRSQSEQICFSGKIDGRLLQFTLDLTKMFLFRLRSPSCKHGTNTRVGSSVIDYIGPTLRFPEFLQTRGSRMKNDIRFADLRIPQKRGQFFACCLWQFQTKCAGSIPDSDRPKSSEIAAYCVHVPHAELYNVAINASPDAGASARPARRNAFSRAG